MHTFADPLKRAVQVAAAGSAVIDGDEVFTHAELADRCARLGGGLAGQGLARGDRVAILAANRHEYLETYVGVPAAGFVVVPLNTRHAQPELEYALRDSGTRLLERGALCALDRGNPNVYSTEVEEALHRHPAVLEAAEFGIPDDKWGEAVHAVVVPRPGRAQPDAAELIAFCREQIAGYKVPKANELRSEPLPKSGPGKVLKRELRAPSWKGQQRGVH